MPVGWVAALSRVDVAGLLAEQIVGNDLPEVWQTAKRLLAAGLDRRAAFTQLALAFTPVLLNAVAGDMDLDRASYLARLERLPMPTTAQFVVALLDVARAQGPLEAAELDRLAAEGLGVSNDDPVIQEMLDQLAERLADEGGPLALLAGGGPPGIDVMAYAEARALDLDDEGSMAAAMADPLVLDAVLHEGGWFDRFLAERGPLLPADEAPLAQTWTLVDRSVYEVLDVDAGNAVRVRDERTAGR